ncbi:MAG: DUF6868 family protein [Planctomycetota bacterium]|jgi:hypothetical protein
MTANELRVFLGWCSVINIVLMTVSFLIMVKARPWAYKMHSKWFAITEEQFTMAIYCFFGVYKVLVFVFNIVPWIVLSIPLWL